ncbi:MAG: hypothetical protein KBA46_04895 [Candidatus Omnitrophica bacterium]|nr:hypothetical protein [Candidatus Omnitrophota bacterium]
MRKHNRHFLRIIVLFGCVALITTCNAAQEKQTRSKEVTLRVRDYRPSRNVKKFDTELDSKHIFVDKALDLSKTALILIDVWDYHPNDGSLSRLKKNISEKVVPLVEWARNNGVQVVHAAHRSKISSLISVLPQDINLDEQDSDHENLAVLLHNKGIETLLYAGYASNMCLINRGVGIYIMRRLHQFDILVVRDCTLAFEMPETLDKQWCNLVAINMIEANWGASTTLDDLQKATAYAK